MAVWNATKVYKSGLSLTTLRGVISVVGLLVVWELGRRLQVPFFAAVPAPSEVVVALEKVIGSGRFWSDWAASYSRVLVGFVAAQIIGIPLGLAMAMNRPFYHFIFPPLEVLRPIPPLAWVPTAIIFWPTTELSIAFVIFLGAFFTVVLNVLGGVEAIDVNYRRAAISMGARPWHIFWRVVLPATAPSIFTGMAVGMGLTWEIVVAAEMVASIQAGLGFMMWQAYVGGSIALIIVAMISIGLAGLVCSSAIWALGRRATPWRRRT